jgi:energy-coupling factor transporter ATP-binding protein EcfA2
MNVVERVAALHRFVQASQGFLPEPELAAARALVERTGERLALSRTHTVVALAGSTGSGKSSIFNALAGVDASPTGVRRPTTGETHACAWGSDHADGLLDWLGVTRRVGRPAEPGLDGLVLLDLPDFDSVEQTHRREADRLLKVVDLIVWVLHPQKYADKIVHKSYLARFHRHREITVVVLNQADLLSSKDLDTCVADLRRLLDDDGLLHVPLLTSSTVGPPGLQALSKTLAKTVAARQAALRRLEADVADVTAAFSFPRVGDETLDKAAQRSLTDALSRAAGVPMVANAVERAYVHRARKVTGWPPLRWLRRMRPDPLGRLHLGEHSGAASSIGPAAPAARAAVSLALRETAAAAGKAVPEPWKTSVLDAVRSKMDDLPDALDQVIARADLGLLRPRRWWHVVGALQWMAIAVWAAGLAWLAVRYVLFALALPEPPMPQLGALPWPTALLIGGLLTGLLLSLVIRPFVRFAARRLSRRVERRLRVGVEQTARDFVIKPAASVLQSYASAASELQAAQGFSACRPRDRGRD